MWHTQRARVAVNTDNMAALTMAASLRAKGSKAFKLIAREMAMTFAQCSFEPSVVEHLPGIADVLADTLSRRYEPVKGIYWETKPAVVKDAVECHPAVRDVPWYLTMAMDE